jgi:AraC-like DNA-binding protein
MQRLVLATENVPEGLGALMRKATRHGPKTEVLRRRVCMSASVEVSTGQVRAHERVEFWRDRSKTLFGLDTEYSERAKERFDATRRMENKGPLVRMRLRSDAYVASRTRRNIDQLPWNSYFLYREISGGAWFEAGTKAVTRRGSLVVLDPDRPFQTRSLERFEHDTLLIPKAFIDPHLPGSNRLRLNLLNGLDGVEALALALVDALGREWDRIPEAAIAKTADALGQLVAVACGAAAGEHREAVSAARLAEARRYVDRHLAEPGLTAEKAAAALKISVRQLYLLFEPSGESFARYVTRRRLEECRAAFLDPVGGRSTTDIAFAWGFNSLATFHRNFREAFGITPGEVRGAAASHPSG